MESTKVIIQGSNVEAITDLFKEELSDYYLYSSDKIFILFSISQIKINVK